jgi:hypothetical protein
MSDPKRERPRRADPPPDPEHLKGLEVEGLLSLTRFLAEPAVIAPQPDGAPAEALHPTPGPRHEAAEVAARLVRRMRYRMKRARTHPGRGSRG